MEIELIGVSQNIELIRKQIDQVADTDLNIVVCGETGVGKEVVVRSLYEKSKRCGKPFVKVNCAALPDTLLESEMFGYERGAFTGAQKKTKIYTDCCFQVPRRNMRTASTVKSDSATTIAVNAPFGPSVVAVAK